MNEKEKEQSKMLNKILDSLFKRRFIPEGFIFESEQVESQMYSGFDLESPFTMVYGNKGVGKQRLINQRLTLENKFNDKQQRELFVYEMDSALLYDPKTPAIPMIELLIQEDLKGYAEQILEATSEPDLLNSLENIAKELESLPEMTEEEFQEFISKKLDESGLPGEFEAVRSFETTSDDDSESDNDPEKVSVKIEDNGLLEEIRMQRIDEIIQELASDSFKYIFVFNNLSGLATNSKVDASLSLFAEAAKKSKYDISFIFSGDEEDFKYASSSKSFIDLFNVFKVEELTGDHLDDLLLDSVEFYEQYYGVKVSTKVLEYAKKQADKYIKHISRPGNTEKLLSTSLSLSLKREAKRLSVSDIDNGLSVITGININVIKDPVKTLDDRLKSKIIGQDEVINKVSKMIQVRLLGIKQSRGVLFSMLAFGTSGVGKTLIAETLSEVLNGSNRFLRLDIGSFKSEELSSARLIGVPIGYKGSEQGGELTEFVKQNPNGVVLVDEIEKGPEDVMDIFLSILDNGRITDARGTIVDFSQITMIFTTNAGSKQEDQERRVGFGSSMSKPKVFGENTTIDNIKFLSDWFKPEFLNRFDEVVRFNDLTEDDLRIIARNTIDDSIQVARNEGYKFTLSDIEKDQIIEDVVKTATNGRQAFKASSKLTESILLDKYLNE